MCPENPAEREGQQKTEELDGFGDATPRGDRFSICSV